MYCSNALCGELAVFLGMRRRVNNGNYDVHQHLPLRYGQQKANIDH
jgi:hypothetical protein